MRLLLATADEDLRDLLTYWLGGHGYDVREAADAERALLRWQSDQPDLALLDLSLPQDAGFWLCQELARAVPSGLSLVLTRAGHRQEDEVRALEAGAAACVSNPFSPALLLAHLRALVRRAKLARVASTGGRFTESLMQVGPLSLDALRHEVTGPRGHAHLTAIESRLLHVLMTNASQVLSTTLLVERVWGYDCDDRDSSALVKTHMRHLRQKVEVEPSAPRHLVTVPGCGYSFMARTPSDPSSTPPSEHALARQVYA